MFPMPTKPLELNWEREKERERELEEERGEVKRERENQRERERSSLLSSLLYGDILKVSIRSTCKSPQKQNRIKHALSSKCQPWPNTESGTIKNQSTCMGEQWLAATLSSSSCTVCNAKIQYGANLTLPVWTVTLLNSTSPAVAAGAVWD